MKVYIVIRNSAYAYDETVSVLGTFTSRKQARKELLRSVRNDCNYMEEMIVETDTPDHFEAYLDGYAAQSHFYVSIVESEIAHEPATKHKARIFFGEALADAVADGDMKEAKRLLLDGDGEYVERTFDSEAERRAYYQGVNDDAGWMGEYQLDDDEKAPRWAKNAQ